MSPTTTKPTKLPGPHVSSSESPERLVTERKLRPVVEMTSAADQIAAFEAMTGTPLNAVEEPEKKTG